MADTVFEVRKLLRAARAGTLATLADGGQPFASLVTPACASDLSVLLLMSDLSAHTRHLRAEPKCSVLVVGAPEGVNAQTAPRVTVTGLAEPIDDPAAKARYLAIHPYAAHYADFGDFRVWRLRVLGGLYVGGFARAQRLKGSDIAPDPAAVAAIASAEAEIIAHCNQDHAGALAAIVGEHACMVAADIDGCDLSVGERVVRVDWSAPVSDAGGVRNELVRLTREARERASR